MAETVSISTLGIQGFVASLDAVGVVDRSPQPPVGWTPSNVVFPGCTTQPVTISSGDSVTVAQCGGDPLAVLNANPDLYVAEPQTSWGDGTNIGACATIACTDAGGQGTSVYWDGSAWQGCSSPT